MHRLTLNVGGRLLDLSTPQIMGIVNVTPDSFYAASRVAGEKALRQRFEQIRQEGGSLIDLGAYSSRPGAEVVSPEDERERLRPALRLLREEYPEFVVSVDTFRSEIARFAVEEYGAHIINDISGGTLDSEMFATVARLQVPYILMHMRGTPETMQSLCSYQDLGLEVLDFFVQRSEELKAMGLHDLIIDPGFGFAKTLEQNYQLMAYMPRLVEALGLPLLVGISRKSMIYKLLGTSPEESLTGTTALNMYALMQGAHILRVHDVRAAAETLLLYQKLQEQSPSTENTIWHYSRSPYTPNPLDN
ncbi:MAG: dihydropteroate synthase [Porphyromonas sp.]|nr:dihydropteroate synthase [Porphyromonas sp.]